MTLEPFRVSIPQSALDDLRDRLASTRFTDQDPQQGRCGVPLDTVRRLVDYWLTGYDWPSWEARLNEHPQFVTEIDGERIHFLHVRSPEPDAFPLVLSHGWPGSVVEFLRLVGPLSDPRKHSGEPADAFHLVIPSLPGFAFSGPTRQPGWGVTRTARAWAELMSRLGYEGYGAHGTQISAFPSGDPETVANLAHALADSPAGLLGWNGQGFLDDAMAGGILDDDFVLTNVSIYWFTKTAGSAARMAYEAAKEPRDVPGVRRFAGYLEPEVMTTDIRESFRRLR